MTKKTSSHNDSLETQIPASENGKISDTLKAARTELFDAIDNQNEKFGDRQKKVSEWYEEKVAKFVKRGKDKKEAEKMASRQIQKVWSEIFKEKMVTPGTNKGNKYVDIGDSDGEGAIYLMKRFLFGRRYTSAEYVSHEEIETRGKAETLTDAKMMKMLLDGGGVPGVNVTANEGKGLRSSWTQSRMIVDHHPEGPTSTTGMIAKMLEIIHMIPEKEKKTVEKFVKTIDIVDSFLSKAGRGIDVEKNYAKSLISFSYQLNSEQLYKLCEQLPDDIGPMDAVPEKLLDSIEVITKDRKDKVKLRACVEKKQKNIDRGAEMIREKITANQFITIDGKKFLILSHKDTINSDAMAVLSAAQDFGTIKVHENGEIFMVHDQGIPGAIQEHGLTVRDVLFLLNPKIAKDKGIDYQGARLAFTSKIPDGPGKDYLLELLSLLPKAAKEELKKAVEEVEAREKTEESEKKHAEVSQQKASENAPENKTEDKANVEKSADGNKDKKPKEKKKGLFSRFKENSKKLLDKLKNGVLDFIKRIKKVLKIK